MSRDGDSISILPNKKTWRWRLAAGDGGRIQVTKSKSGRRRKLQSRPKNATRHPQNLETTKTKRVPQRGKWLEFYIWRFIFSPLTRVWLQSSTHVVTAQAPLLVPGANGRALQLDTNHVARFSHVSWQLGKGSTPTCDL